MQFRNVETEVLIVMALKGSVFWNITPHSSFFKPEDGGDMFIRNVGLLSTDYMTSHPRK
jgi:hypothetical protein